MDLKIEQVTCLTLTFATLMTLTSGSVITFSVGDVNVELQGWGTVSLERSNDTLDLDHTRFTLRVSEISVLESSETVLVSHLDELTRQEYEIDQWAAKKYENLKVLNSRLYTAALGDLSGDVEMFVNLFSEDGDVKVISEDYGQPVKVGDAYVVINLNDVTKCSACGNAAFVDVRVEFKSNKAKLPTQVIPHDNSQVVHIPASSGTFMGNKATLDGTRTEVAEGYPKVEQGDDKTDIIVRFPAFSKSASYGVFVRQDRQTPEEAKKGKGTLGALLQAHSGGNNCLNNYSFVTWVISLTCFLFLRLVQ